MTIAAVGRLGSGAEALLYERYVGRLHPRPAVVEIAEAKGAAAEARRREAALLLAAVPAGRDVIALDQDGVLCTSESLAAQINDTDARAPCFVIGGPHGLDASVLAAARLVISFGRLTWPHQLVRVMLAEQLYRAQCIAAGHPYHRADRP